jgi:hypothetical protein
LQAATGVDVADRLVEYVLGAGDQHSVEAEAKS